MSDEEEKYRKELNTFQQSLNILKCENCREMWAIIQAFIGATIFSELFSIVIYMQSDSNNINCLPWYFPGVISN